MTSLARGELVGSSPIRAATNPWMVLHTRSRQEKALARFLAVAAIEHYLPLMDRVTIVRGRKQVSKVPLFPGYLFISGDLDDAYRAMSTKRVCQIIRVTDQHQLAVELEQIEMALAQGAELYRCPFAVVGVRCRVTKGPFEGVEGVVSSQLGGHRLALLIETLGRGAILEIDRDLLEPVQ